MSIKGLAIEAASYIPKPLYRRLLAIREVTLAMPDPVLVYQMGKVGSKTVHTSLREAGIGSVHVHYIDPKSRLRAKKLFRENNADLPAHFYKGRLLHHWVNSTNRQVRVVSIVRDPIARHVSSAFQIPDIEETPTKDAEASVRALEKQIRSTRAWIEYAYEWFDREVHSAFGIDVFEHPFNQEKGYGRITQENVDLLILTLEQLSDLIPTVLSDFVDASLRVQRDNTRTDNVYAEVKKRLRLPESRVRRLYDHPWMRHFYTEQDIEKFVGRWSKTSDYG